MKRILSAILTLTFMLTTFPTNMLAEDGTASQEPYVHYIDWPFTVYAEPDYQAEKIDSFPPQQVLVYERGADGWALIHTYKGACWTNLNENKRYVNRYYYIYNNRGDTTAVGEIGEQIVTVIKQQDHWILIETWLGSKWIDTNAIRNDVLLDVPAYNQRSLGYPTGCEIVSAAMLINHTAEADIQVLVSEMPRSHDPYTGFVGTPSNEKGFTIFPSALLGLIRQYLGSAEDLTGGSMDALKRKLNDGAPVVAWVSGLGFDVHAICLTGYDEAGFYYNDPWHGTKDVFITYDRFYKIWNEPIAGYADSTRKALSYTPDVKTRE